jgi:phenylacetate-CoA ligase
MSCSHLGPDTLRDYAKALQEFKPQVLWVYPSNMEWLCHLLTQAGIEFKVPHVLSSSEVLGSTAWRMAQEVLGANVADYYGQAERVGFGYAMAHGQFHFTPGYALVELVPVEGDTTNRLREIVGTTLWNHAMPLVRYRSGDLVELPENCSATQIEEICLGLRPVTGVLGRTVEFMVSPAGSILNGVGNFTKNTQHIVRLQVQQDELARIAVHLLVEPGFSATDLQQVERNVRDNISPGMQFSVEVVTELTRTAVGKTPLVIHGPAIKQYLTEHNLIGGRR